MILKIIVIVPQKKKRRRKTIWMVELQCGMFLLKICWHCSKRIKSIKKGTSYLTMQTCASVAERMDELNKKSRRKEILRSKNVQFFIVEYGKECGDDATSQRYYSCFNGRCSLFPSFFFIFLGEIKREVQVKI